MDFEAVTVNICKWIRSTVESAGASGLVIGVSGGIDAAVCAALSVRALGGEGVTPVLIQTTGNEDEHRSALEVCSRFELTPLILDYRDAYKILDEVNPPASAIVKGNFRDRLRSAALYYLGNQQNRLVISTVNKNEYLLGYFCKNGSGTTDLMPIADLYKTEIWALGKYLGVPSSVVEKVPTGDYWQGQTDEAVIGVPYADQDLILHALERNGTTMERTADYERIKHMIKSSAHKRQLPPRYVIPENLRALK